MESVLVCVKGEGGVDGGGAGRIVCAACHSSFSRHMHLLLVRLTPRNTCAGKVVSVVPTHNCASSPDHLTSSRSLKTIICNISALKCRKRTRLLMYCQQCSNPEIYIILLQVTLHFLCLPVASTSRVRE